MSHIFHRHVTSSTAALFPLVLNNNLLATMSETAATFNGNLDRYKGITVRSQEEPCDENEFQAKLEQSLTKWKEQGVRGVWFHVHLADTKWVPILASHGFNFHHSKNQELAMTKWLPEDEECRIPSYAHHNVGVGGIVVNSKDEVLVVKERFSFLDAWKFPGGYVDPGENIHDAAVREVQEETGIKTKFRSIVVFRHAHNYNFGCSDIYIITSLEPISDDIEQCKKEIAACQWIPIKAFLEDKNVLDINKYFLRKFLDARQHGFEVVHSEMELKIRHLRRAQHLFAVSDRKKSGQ